MTAARAPGGHLRLFEGYGIEIEYVIVDRETLDVRPLSDRVLESVSGRVESEVDVGPLSWSNELVMHVVELKTNGPAPRLEGLAERFQADVRRIDGVLEAHGARLMPTGMHPWMDPAAETRLWRYEHSAVYEAYDRIFDCRGHGWSNLQSTHVNLPFAGDEEFGRLHAAVRAVLPILPALSASSPFVDGVATGAQDNRMRVYRKSSARVPSVSGLVVPEPVYDRAGYEEEVLGRIYRDLAPLDPEGVLRHEFANARGAIARFDRHAIEIRVLDVQEHPGADLAIAAAARSVVRALAEERLADRARLRGFPTERLADLLWRVADDSDRAAIRDREYLELLGYPGGDATAGELWIHLVETCMPAGGADADPWRPAIGVILDHGSLSRRILAAAGPAPTRARLAEVYRELCDCLAAGRAFLP